MNPFIADFCAGFLFTMGCAALGGLLGVVAAPLGEALHAAAVP